MPVNLSQPAAAAEPPDQPTPWLTAAQAAKRAHVGPETIYRAARASRLRHARVGGRRKLLFRADWIDQWLDATAEGPIEVTRAPSLRVAR
jgi:excisionase family DNA binding protein